MKNAITKKALADFRDMIVQVRGVSVIVDSDLAQAYGVTTKALNQAIKRNIDKFPPDFMICLSFDEAKEIFLLRSQFVTLKQGCHPKYPPKAFTEHGALMAATILNSPQAVQMSVFVVRAFVAMRSLLMTQRDLAKKLAALERTLTARLDTHEHAISDIIRQIMLLLSPPPQEEPQDPPRPRIGFSVRERRAAYRTTRTG
ncbi:MAG: ORF6N domain-containing protein [bacterium]